MGGQQVDEEVLDGAGDAAGALVDARLEHPGRIVAPGEEGHPVLEDPLHDAQGQPLGDVDPEFLAEDALPERNASPEHFLPKQDDTDDGQYLRRFRPGEVGRAHEGVDGIHRAVQHDGVHLRQQGAEEGQRQGGEQQEAVRLHIGNDSLEQLGERHSAGIFNRHKDNKSVENADTQRTISQSTTPTETETFSECLVPYWGISRDRSQASTTS